MTRLVRALTKERFGYIDAFALGVLAGATNQAADGHWVNAGAVAATAVFIAGFGEWLDRRNRPVIQVRITGVDNASPVLREISRIAAEVNDKYRGQS